MSESLEYNYEVDSAAVSDTPVPVPYAPSDMNPYYCASLYRCTLPSQEEEASCNVYTSNLPLWADDDWLRQCFSPFGFIVSAKVMTDFHGSPKGYGFVQFTHSTEAQAAVQAMHGVWVDGRWMNVKLAHRDKNKGLRNQPSNNLYLCNLPKHYNFADVKHIFQGIPVSNMTILRDSNTKASRGVALVRLPTLQHAMMAIDVLNGILLTGHDRPLEVKYAESEEEKAIRKNDSNMMDHWHEDDSCYFDSYENKCNNTKAHIPTNRPIARIKIDKNKVDRPKTPPSPSCTVYIEDLGYDVDELYLYQLCSPYGAIESAKIDWSGDSGRVRFATPEQAAAARESLDGKTVDDVKLRARLIEDEPLQHARS